MEVDNVVEGSLIRVCVFQSLPLAANIAVLLCSAAPELISYTLLWLVL